MVANILNLESLKMRDELIAAVKAKEQAVKAKEQAVREATEQAAREATEQTSLSNIEMMKQLGFTFTEEQEQKILEYALEQQKLNTRIKPEG